VESGSVQNYLSIHILSIDIALSFSILPALSLNGILSMKIVEGSFDTVLFYQFIDELLDNMQPFPARNSVIVMDNCPIHKFPQIRALIADRSDCFLVSPNSQLISNLLSGMHCVFLPPYSPNYNPIELAFSAIKSYI
jgi:hypothetical protein